MSKEDEKLAVNPFQERTKVPIKRLPLSEVKKPPLHPHSQQQATTERRPEGNTGQPHEESIGIEDVAVAVSSPELHRADSRNQHSPIFKRDNTHNPQGPSPEALKELKPAIKVANANELNPDSQLLEQVKARKYSKEFFEKSRKENIGLTTLAGQRRETTVIRFGKPENEEVGGQQFDHPPSLDSNEQIPNMDILLNTIDQNTSMKIKLEKAILEFNLSPNKAFDFLWKEKIVILDLQHDL